MKLLITTQKVDIRDNVLGFMHGWIAEFAKHCESIIVICLQKGECDLPENVKVLSLGKEKLIYSHYSNLRYLHIIRRFALYLYRFYKYIWQERKNYDKVFVHMNKEYVVLGGLFWRLWGKKIVLWYNHTVGNWMTRLAMALSHRVFYVSPFAFTAKSKKSIQMPAGINTEIFQKAPGPYGAKKGNTILYLGRISPVKKLEALISAAELLDKKGIDFKLNIYGEPTESDKEYDKKIKRQAEFLASKGKVYFCGSKANLETPQIYDKHQLFINLTQSGSFDKTILEAMACEAPAIVSNQSLRGVLPEELLFKENDAEDLAQKIESFLQTPQEEKDMLGKKFRKYVIENHSLDLLIEKLIKTIK